MNKLHKLFNPYLIAVVSITLGCGIIYLVIQQNLRQGANKPQIQMAHDTADSMVSGRQPFLPNEKIDLSKTLDPFLAIYDQNGHVQDSNAQLDGQLPAVPVGIFDEAKNREEYRVTWQPTPDVRQALVVVPVKNEAGKFAGQFVVAGRSLRNAERNEKLTLIIFTIAWVILIFLSIRRIMARSKQTKNEFPPSFAD